MAAMGTRPCPHCGGEIMASAILCKYCREKVKPVTRASTSSEVCPHCDSHLKPNAKFCGKCGESVIVSAPSRFGAPPPRVIPDTPPPPIHQQVPESVRAKYKNPDSLIFPKGKKNTYAAVLLNIFWPGAAQIYLGQIAFGLLLSVVTVVLALMTVGVGYFLFVFPTVVWAWRDARRINKGLPIHKWSSTVKEK